MPADVKQKAETAQKRKEGANSKTPQNKPTKPIDTFKLTPLNLMKIKSIDKEPKVLPEKTDQTVGEEEQIILTYTKEKESTLINQTASQNEDLDLQELDDDSSDDQELTQPTTGRVHRPRKSKSKSKKNNIEAIYKNLHLACVYKTALESNILAKDLHVVLGCLRNWELISEKKSRFACKALKLIAQSCASFLLTEAKSIMILTRLLKSSNVGLDIKLSIVKNKSIII